MVRCRRIHHGESIRRELALLVAGGGAIRPTVAAPVECEHSIVPGEVRDLHLPVARVDDRPRWKKENSRTIGSVQLVVKADTIALDVAGVVRISGPRLLRRHAGRHRALAIFHPSGVSTRCRYS